ncbi:unannotated protein [freshwater metagenome]|uniref:Unannotated protein n=1 Tax=freshwater metagenome TaxID=449393 RepID=A0A6J6FDZ9_9ZZZZ
MHDHTGMAWEIAGPFVFDCSKFEQVIDRGAFAREFNDAGPAVVAGEFVSVFIGVQANDRSFQAQGEVLGDNSDLVAFSGEVACHCEDPVIVGVASK